MLSNIYIGHSGIEMILGHWFREVIFPPGNRSDRDEREESVMNVTPLIPDGFNGPVKQLTCRICKHVFYLTQDDYRRLPEVRFCHECSLILLEELQGLHGTQGAASCCSAARCC